MSHVLGTHPLDNGGIDMAVRRASAAGMRAVQIFTAIPKFYGDRASIRPERIERFQVALEETGMRAEHVLVHAAYVLNVASDEEEKWRRAAAGLAKEMERSVALGVGGVCFHPGSAKGGVAETAVRVAKAMTGALRATEGATRLFVENTAGAGSTFGRTAEEIARILASLPEDVRPKAGYGLDTCHLFASGYDIAHSKELFVAVLDSFESIVGAPPSFFHLNDSVGALGSHRDRHALLGEGEMGEAPFSWLLEDHRSHDVPLVLETPQQNTDVDRDDSSADPYDLRMFELLGRLGAEV